MVQPVRSCVAFNLQISEKEQRMFLRTVGEEGPWLPAYSPFPIMFYNFPKTNRKFSVTFILLQMLLTLSQMKFFDSSKLRDFADDYFELDENGRKFSKQKTVGKGEIARQKTCTADT